MEEQFSLAKGIPSEDRENYSTPEERKFRKDQQNIIYFTDERLSQIKDGTVDMTVGGGTAVGSAIIIASSVGVDTVSFGTTLIPSTGAKVIGATGFVSDAATKNNIVPALRYDNPNERGRSYIKFDGIEKNGTYLIDSKTNIPYWNKQAMSKTFTKTLDRINDAKKQNPDIKVIYEFPNNTAKEKLLEWIKENRDYENVIDVIRKRGE